MHRPPRIRVAGLVVHDDKVLLIRQGRPDRPRWMLPGGGVEGGESLMVALARELGEEIGLTSCDMGDPVALVESIAPPSNPSGRHLIHIIFQVSCDASAIERLQVSDPDVHELRMFTRQELMDVPIHPPIAGFLAEWQPGYAFSYFGQLWAP